MSTNHFTGGFCDELEKLALAGKALGLIGRHPGTAIGGALTGASVLLAGKRGYESGLRGGEGGRYLPQRVVGGYAIPSPSAFRNWNIGLKRQLRKGKTGPTKHYRKGMYGGSKQKTRKGTSS